MATACAPGGVGPASPGDGAGGGGAPAGGGGQPFAPTHDGGLGLDEFPLPTGGARGAEQAADGGLRGDGAVADGGPALDASDPEPPVNMPAEPLPPLLGERCSDYEVPQTSGPNCPEGTFEGAVRIASAADLAQLEGCSRITGDLHVQTNDVLGGFSALSSLRVVQGDLILSGTGCQRAWCPPFLPVSLRGLDQVTCVGGDLDAGGLLAALDPLTSLQEVQGNVAVAVQVDIRFPALRRVWGNVKVGDLSSVPALAEVDGAFPNPDGSGPVDSAALPSLEYVGCGGGQPYCRNGILGCSPEITTAEELQTLGTCVYALGDLKLRLVPASDLEALRALRRVRGELQLLATEVTSLAGLSGLEQVGALRLFQNDALTEIVGLGQLRFHSFAVVNNASLVHVDVRLLPLEASGVWLEGNPVLATLSLFEPNVALGGLVVEAMPLLHSLAVSDLLVTANLSLTDLPLLDDLSGIRLAKTLGAVKLAGLAIRDLEVLKPSQALTSLTLQGLPEITDLTELSALATLEKLELIELLRVQSLHGLEGIQVLDTLTLEGLPLGDGLAGLSSLRAVRWMELHRLSEMATLSGLANLSSLGGLQMTGLVRVRDLHGLEAVTGEDFYLTLSNNPALERVDGLSGVVSGRSVYITDNTSLVDLHGFERLERMSDPVIDGNPVLPDCEVDWLLEKTGRRDQIDGWVNGGPLLPCQH